VQIKEKQLCGRTLKIFKVQNKPNLVNIFKSYLGYHDLQGLCNSHDYFEKLRKKIICNDQATWYSNIFCHFYIY
jgi:hypothetical protein